MRTGLHANDSRDHAKILDYYRRSGANVFKTLVYQDALLTALKQMDVTIIGRLHTDRQALGGSVARDFTQRVLDSARRHPDVDYWEGYNEAFHVASEIGRYAEFEIDRMKALEAIGKKAVIGCFSTGTPEITDGGATWRKFKPALDHALANGHALGLHEYSGPYMQYLVRTPDGKNQWDARANRFTGVGADQIWDPSLDGWLTLRYRMVYRLFAEMGLAGLPLFITEGGIDDATPRPGPGGKGYKAFARTEWARLPGIGDYAAQRHWYQWHVSHDTFVKGVVDFGWEGTGTGWPDFDLATDAEMLDRIVAAEQSLPRLHGRPARPGAPAPSPSPSPAPPPAPAPGPSPSPAPAAARVIGPLPMVVVQAGGLLDVARHVYPDVASAAEIERLARAIAAANGLDFEAVKGGGEGGSRPLLPRHLALPGHRVART